MSDPVEKAFWETWETVIVEVPRRPGPPDKFLQAIALAFYRAATERAAGIARGFQWSRDDEDKVNELIAREIEGKE